MKTKEELEQIKEEYSELNKKLDELSEDELKQVTGGLIPVIFGNCGSDKVSTELGIEYYEPIKGSYGGITVEEWNSCNFTGNHANGSAGGVYYEGNS